jgi:hypothetical protein
LKFAELAGIKYQTFAIWAQKRRHQRGANPAAGAPLAADQVRWLEAVVERAPGSVVKPDGPGLVLHLPGGARLEIGDMKQAIVAAALLRALQRPC